MTNEYKQALDKAKGELDEHLRQRGEIDRQIIRLKTTVEALSALCEEPDFSMPLDLEVPKGFGITMTIRKILSDTNVPISAVVIRDAMESYGIDMTEYANSMAVIHNTLKRLIEQREVMQVRNQTGQTIGYSLYKGIPTEPPMLESAREPAAIPPPLTLDSPVYKSGMRGDEKPKERKR